MCDQCAPLPIKTIQLVPTSGNFEAGTVVEVEQYTPGPDAKDSSNDAQKNNGPTVLDAIEAARVELETWIQYADNAGLSASITRKVVLDLEMAEWIVRYDPMILGDYPLSFAVEHAL